MNFTETILAAALAVVATGAHAVPVALTGGNFVMYSPGGGVQDTNSGEAGTAANVTGWIDTAAGTFSVASSQQYAYKYWTASGGTLYGPGTYTVNVNGDGGNGAGAGDLTFTVGAGQIGGNINFAWGTNSGHDVFNVWDVVSATSGGFTTTTYTSSNMNAVAGSVLYNGVAVATDTWPGIKGVDGAIQGYSANFNMTTVTPAVPEASTYGMMLAGLGLVGFMARRRKLAKV